MLDRLEALAREADAARRGEWFFLKALRFGLAKPDADYIHAANPAAVLKLIAAVRAAKYVALSNGFDAALPDKMAALRLALAELER